MKLKKKHFKKLKEIAVAVNQIVPGTGDRLDKLIAEIESVQKVKTVQERPLNKTAAFLEACHRHQQEYYANALKEGEYMVAASTNEGTVTDGLRKYLSDSTDWKPLEFGGSDFTKTVDIDTDPKIGDVGYFNTGTPNAPIVEMRKGLSLKEAYEILKQNVRYSSASCPGFVYLSQIEELLECKPKYNQSLINKVYNREAVIEVDDFTIIKDLINFMYPDDPYLEDEFSRERTRTVYYTQKNPYFNIKGNIYYNRYFWGSSFYDPLNFEMEDKPRIKASEFLLK